MNPERDISKGVPLLQRAWQHLIEEYPKRYPSDPLPFLVQVSRPTEKQAAYYAQGRRPLQEVNSLRKVAGLPAIKEAENKQTITDAMPGRGKHEKIPAEAFDIAFVKKGTKTVLDYSPRLFEQAWMIVKEIPGMKWGGHFRRVDMPHFEV